MKSREEHATGFESHHGARRQVGDGHTGLADELLWLVESVNARQNRAIIAGSIVQRELQEFLRLRHRLAGQDLHRSEIGPRESFKVHVVLEQRLDLHV